MATLFFVSIFIGAFGCSLMLVNNDEWTKKNISVRVVLAQALKSVGIFKRKRSTQHVLDTERSAIDYHRITKPLQIRLSKLHGKPSGQSYKLLEDNIACRKWPGTSHVKQIGPLPVRTLGTMLYLEHLHWALAMEQKSKIMKENRLFVSYKKLQKELTQWLLMENDSLVAAEYEQFVLVPVPPELDGQTRTGYGIAITNLVIENLYLFVQCVNSGNESCSVWSGCRLEKIEKDREEKLYTNVKIFNLMLYKFVKIFFC